MARNNRQIISRAALVTLFMALLAMHGDAAENPSRGEAHARTSCSRCHGTDRMSGKALVRAACQACVVCHDSQPTTAAGPVDFHARARGRCLSCHGFHDTSRIKTSLGTIDRSANARVNPDQCRSCHASDGRVVNLSEAHLAAARLYHTDSRTMWGQTPSQACLNCHSSAAATAWIETTGPTRLTFSEHASHPVGIPVVPGQGDIRNHIRHELDSRLPLFAGRIECQTCHQITAPADDLLIPFEPKYGLCQGCHQHNGDNGTDPVPGPLLATSSSR